MPKWTDRRHIHHYEVAGGTVHVTWRLKEGQAGLTPPERTVVIETLRRAPEFGGVIAAAVAMDDHVHVLFLPGDRRTSTQFVQSWKGHTSRIICAETPREAPLWQRDFYQRWIRHPGHLDLCTSYILANPERRWPGIGAYPWVLPPT